MFIENTELNCKINNLIERQESQKLQAKQLWQYIRSSWMIEIADISFQKEENCIQLISKLAELSEITNQIKYQKSNRPSAYNFYNNFYNMFL